MKKFVFWSKVALLLVIIGFFQPIACNQNGVNLARICWAYENYAKSIFIWAILFVALVSVCITIYKIYKAYKDRSKVEDTSVLDWGLLGLGIISMIIAKASSSNDYGRVSWESGAYFILIGYTLSFILLIADKLTDSTETTFNFGQKLEEMTQTPKNLTSVEKGLNKDEMDKKEKWVSKRLLELIKEGKTASDARIQAEAEYVSDEPFEEKEEKIEGKPWVCKKCGTLNPFGTRLCQKCEH